MNTIHHPLSEKSVITPHHHVLKFVSITVALLICMTTLSTESLLGSPPKEIIPHTLASMESFSTKLSSTENHLLKRQRQFERTFTAITAVTALRMNSISFFTISSMNGTMSFNVGSSNVNSNIEKIVEITYMVDKPNEESNPWLQVTLRPESNLVVNSGSSPNKSFVRSVKNLSGAQMYQHVIRFILTSSLLNSTQDQIIDMFTLQTNAFSVNINLANSTIYSGTTYPTFSNEFFPGIYLYPAFVGFSLLACFGSILIWCIVYRRRKNPAALGERESKICRHSIILSIAFCCYFVTFLAIGSAPIFGMNRSFSKCCASFQSIYFGSDLVLASSQQANTTFNIDASNKLERCVAIVPYQHLFWFGEPVDTEDNLNRVQCVNDEYQAFTTYNYNMIIYLSVFLGVAVLCFPIFHCVITVYANKLYMLTKKQHSGEVTISFHVANN
ncbi:hypothetical protein C9374_007872 [Naegleria lovaniensis]|uniref:Uncharacterized protein n=1 Tax=Naegleria lovaniensis TaxID=51637 RepID=A0AA88GJM3_NAELO|nr:uncharacterized protein C9374_007872 [Naegleria lovaniensis]KAG2378724.1 hypothetical protein C9374_007872 [Naegleria lovaniensis]